MLKIYVSKATHLLFEKEAFVEGEVTMLFPETQLHPSKVAEDTRKLLEGLCKENLSIFTHSMALVSSVGDFIADTDQTFCKKVEVIILEEDCENQVATFCEEGYLKNWQIGFFSH